MKVQEKADEWRRQGFVGPTMAAQAELAYTGIVDTLEALDKEFFLRQEATTGNPRDRRLWPAWTAATKCSIAVDQGIFYIVTLPHQREDG